ncbi:hypothetical protein [Streptomyces hyaluromycini]|uniref:hypothetical protein n=1 Tax=Streptomyces hyaluromycini TaxID=1377993 RepID=UPI0011AE7953|nr:hypothetical protein [Streptomyces hyaluromycini]
MRVLRTAPERRALQLALLVGGLLALGFLCGQQAQAAEGVPSTPSLTSVVPQKASPRDAVTPHRVPVTPVVAGVHEVVRSVTDTVAATVNSPVTSALTETLTETVRQVTELPVVLVVQVPELPVVSEPPVDSAPTPAPVTSAPGPAQPRTPVTHNAGHGKSRTEKKAAATTVVSYGPRSTAVAFAPGTAAHTGGHRAARAADVPTRPAPTGDPDGALGKSAVDAGPSRHGDAYAVTFTDRVPLRLAPGAAARLDAAGTPDRYRDIPLFPG